MTKHDGMEVESILINQTKIGQAPCHVGSGGQPAVALGIIAHFSVAMGAAATYYVVSRWIPAVNTHAILAGATFGAAVHVFMNFVVIPLSRIGPRPIVWPMFLAILAVHLAVVGPSISLTIRWFARRTPHSVPSSA
jgi:uncharacterized membrane protein YagU involved in acid resistance